MATAGDLDRAAFRLLPSERVLWHGRQEVGIPRARPLQLVPLFFFCFAVVSALFAALLALVDLPGVYDSAAVASGLGALGVLALLLPHYVLDGGDYVLTDRRMLVRRGPFTRSMDRLSVTWSRIRWHRSVRGVGDLELVVAVPFGPLARRLRLVLRDVRDPADVLALVRGISDAPFAGDTDLPLVARLDPGEKVVWGGNPEGLLFGVREILTAMLGFALTGLGVAYGVRTGTILFELGDAGLEVGSLEWILLAAAVGISCSVFVGIGLGLAWHGLVRSRVLGHQTEYLLTDKRLLIRRGRTELSVDRHRIVEVADAPAPFGLSHLFLVLDAPHSKALADSGALRPILPSREGVPPVLFDVRDAESVKALILDRGTAG